MKREKLNTEHGPITAANIQDVARAAAYVAIRRAYLASARKVTDVNGETIAHDGNTGGADMIRRLYYGFAGSEHAARATLDKAATDYDEHTDKTTAATLKAALDGYADATANDTDDCINAAALALWENIVENGGETATDDAFITAVRAVHRYIYQQDTNTSTRVRRKYDEKGNLLAVNDYQYIKYPHIYIDAVAGTDDDGNALFEVVDVNDELSKYIKGQRDNDTINDVLAILTATQKRILHYIARGYTYETIGERLDMTTAAVKMQVRRIRQKAAPYKD